MIQFKAILYSIRFDRDSVGRVTFEVSSDEADKVALLSQMTERVLELKIEENLSEN